MSTALRYWRLVKIDAAGRCRTEEFTQAKAFFKRQFSETDASDADIQRELLRLLRQERSFIDDTNCRMAELCLNTCDSIASLFGEVARQKNRWITLELAHSPIAFNP